MLKEREKNLNGTATNNTTVAPSSSSTTVSSTTSAPLNNDTNLNSNNNNNSSNDNNNSGNSQIGNPEKDISNLSPNSQSSSSSVTLNNNNNGGNVPQLQSNEDQLSNALSTKDSSSKCDNETNSDKNGSVIIKKEIGGISGGGNSDNEPNVDLMHTDNPNEEGAPNSSNNSNNTGLNRVTIKTEEQIETSLDGFSTTPGGNGINQEPNLTNNGNSNNNNVISLVHNIQQGNINQKQTNGMEYMQQQSQIFVFSTALANKGAESVLNGQFPSIIAYHCSQPATKKFLEKHPLKITQFNRQNQTTQWLNNVTMAKNNKNQNIRLGPNINNNNNSLQNHQNIPPGAGGGMLGQNAALDKQHIMSMPPHGGCRPSAQDGNSNIGNGINSSVSNESNSDELPWDPDGENIHLDSITNEMPQNSGGRSNSNNSNNINSTNVSADLDMDNLVPEGGNIRAGRNTSTNTGHPSPNYQQSRLMGSISPITGLQPSLQGVKVPDEVLTPQQRQHREESLATIRKMQQLFFPEQGQNMQNPNLPQNPMMPNSGIMQQQQNSIMNQSLSGPNHIKSGGHMGSGPHNRCILPMGQDILPNQNDSMNDLNYRVLHPLNSSQQQSIDILSHHGSIMRPGNRKNVLEDVNVQMQQMINQINTCGSVNQNKSQQQQHMMANSLVGGHGGNNINMNINLGNNFVSAQTEWNKLQHQFYENKGKMGPDMHPGGGPGNFSAQNHLLNQNRQIPLPIRTNSQGPRSQGPPPPYHQTPRSASVPIATQSPNPGSPNNPTSNLSLPSPRATGGSGSTLSSPADLSRQQQSFKHLTTGQSPTSQDSPLPHRSLTQSNPSTPLSSHLSPNSNLKEFDAVNNQNSNNMAKEANLMPVPSPQQIQYLNTFDGQELTIQKQPNTNVKDSQCATSGGSTTSSQQNVPLDRVSGASTPHATNDTRFSSTPGSQNPIQPNSIINNANSTFSVPSSPQTPTPVNPTTAPSNLSIDEKNNRMNQSSPAGSTAGTQNSHQGKRQQNSSALNMPSGNPNPSGNAAVSPGINYSSSQSITTPISTQTNVTSQAGPQTGPTGGIKMGNFMDMSPNNAGAANSNKCGSNQKPPTDQNGGGSGGGGNGGGGGGGGGGGFNNCGRTDNLPLNPNSGVVGTGPKTSHFDPISSLAQMSQQLTSSSINGLTTGGGGGGPAGVMNYGGHSVMNNDFGGGMIPGPPSHDGGGGMMGGLDCAIGGLIPGHYGGPNQMISQGPGGNMILPGGPRSVSPKLGGFSGGVGVPRLLGRSQMGGPFNGANVQVKASAPNTIQYLPTRPQISGNQQSRPPSLDFLHRFTNPMNNPIDVKLSNPSLQFYANCNQMNIPPGHHMENETGPPVSIGDHPGMSPGLGMGGGNINIPPHLMGQNIMIRGMRPHNPNQMMRMPGPPGHLISNHFSNANNSGNVPEQIFTSGGPPNAQMFVAGSKNSPIINNNQGDNSQQIPSSMSGPNNNGPVNGGNNGSVNTTANQSNNPHGGIGSGGGGGGGHNLGGGPPQQNPNSFKPQFIGPSTADPNYAQQFHNFQQQLYATNTRSQLNQQQQHQQQGGLNPIQSFFVPK